jgi:hypothetical protein
MLKQSASKKKDDPVSPLCSRNARSEKTLVGRAQWGTHQGHPRDNVHKQAWKDYLWLLAAALPAERRVLARRGWAGEMSSLFEHPAGLFLTVDTFQCWTYRHGLSERC